MSTDLLLSERMVAEILDLSIKTLQGWRWRGIGPKVTRVGARTVRYRQSDIDKFIAASNNDGKKSG